MEKKVQTSWGFFISPNSIFDVEDLNTYEKICYLYLCRCGDNEKRAFPSYERIAEKTGVSRRTAMRAIKSLEDKGYIAVKRRKTDKRKNTSNLYTILEPKKVSSDSQSPENICSDSQSPSSSDSQSPSLVTVSHPINTHLKNTHIINTQQQTERVVVVQDKYESLFQEKLTKKQAMRWVNLADKYQVDVLHKIKNIHDVNKVKPVDNVIGSITSVIQGDDWIIPTSANKKSKPMPKAVAKQREGRVEKKEITMDSLHKCALVENKVWNMYRDEESACS